MLYDYIVSFPLSKSVYAHTAKLLNERYKDEPFSMVDIGTGTGVPLTAFLEHNTTSNRILVIDINEAYIARAREILQFEERVEVMKQDWLTFMSDVDQQFDIVFFGFSYMMMKNKEQVLLSITPRPCGLQSKRLSQTEKLLCL